MTKRKSIFFYSSCERRSTSLSSTLYKVNYQLSPIPLLQPPYLITLASIQLSILVLFERDMTFLEPIPYSNMNIFLFLVEALCLLPENSIRRMDLESHFLGQSCVFSWQTLNTSFRYLKLSIEKLTDIAIFGIIFSKTTQWNS